MRRGRLPEIKIPAPSGDALIRAMEIPEGLGTYLVGSWAAGRADALSDVDIAVWVDPDVPPRGSRSSWIVSRPGWRRPCRAMRST